MTRDKSRSALVTGGHGFLGSHLVDLLLERGFAVRCLLRPERSAARLGGRSVEIARGELVTGRGLLEAVAGVDYVFHVAGLVAARSPAEFDAVNARGTQRLAEAVARRNPGCRRLVYVSSQAAAGPSPDGRPRREEDPPRPLTHYGRSKLAGERRLRATLPRAAWAIVRPCALYGPRDQGILPFFQLAARGLRPGLEGRGRRFNLLHGRDAAAGTLAAALHPDAAGGVYFLADAAGGYGYREIGAALGRAFGRPLRRVPVPDLLLDAAAVLTDEVAALTGRPAIFSREKARELKARWWLCAPDRARRELGWEARIDLDDGFVETARWYAEAGKVRLPGGVTPPL